MKTLNHPNLVKMLGVCIEKSPFYLVQVNGGWWFFWRWLCSRSCAVMVTFETTWSLLILSKLWLRCRNCDNDKGLWFWWYFRGRRTKRSLKRCQSFQGWSAGVWTSSEVDCHRRYSPHQRWTIHYRYDCTNIIYIFCHTYVAYRKKDQFICPLPWTLKELILRCCKNHNEKLN